MAVEPARAKINLTLHVGGPIPDGEYKGYHPVDSLVVFANIGDALRAEPAEHTGLTIDGPFSEGLEADDNNLVLKAYHAVAAAVSLPPIWFYLTKNLPPASGIGGGSADAAAALRLLRPYAGLLPEAEMKIAERLGADVPACLRSDTLRMQGIGERLTSWPDMGGLHAVLVNPGVAVSTAVIFKDYDSTPRPPDPMPQRERGTLLERTLAGRNDLTEAAIAAEPVISDCLDVLKALPECRLARMSGSGATCFALFGDATMAGKGAERLRREHPKWWVEPVYLGEQS